MFPLWADEEKPAPVPASIHTTASPTAAPARTASHLPFLNKLQELNTSRFSSTVIVFQSFVADEIVQIGGLEIILKDAYRLRTLGIDQSAGIS